MTLALGPSGGSAARGGQRLSSDQRNQDGNQDGLGADSGRCCPTLVSALVIARRCQILRGQPQPWSLIVKEKAGEKRSVRDHAPSGSN
jgi:hypothetical protein